MKRAPQDSSRHLTEIRDRVRRCETKLTQLLDAQGLNTGVSKTKFIDGEVTVHTMDVSLAEVLGAVPSDWDKSKEIYVIHRDNEVCSFFLP